MNHFIGLSVKSFFLGPGVIVILGAIVGLRPWLRPAAREWIALQTLLTFLLLAYFSPLASYSLSSIVLSRAEEMESKRPTSCLQTYPVVVVLGAGMASPDLPTTAAQERLLTAAGLLGRLGQAGMSRTVILSGGPTLPAESATEAEAAEVFLRKYMGADFDRHRFLREDESLNTHDNAVRSLALIKRQNLSTHIVLVTSALHLPRSVGTFQAAGFQVCPLASWSPSYDLWISFDNAIHLAMALNEILGVWIYRLRGWA